MQATIPSYHVLPGGETLTVGIQSSGSACDDRKGDATQPAGGQHLRSERLSRAIGNASQSWEHAAMCLPVVSKGWHSETTR